MHVFLSKKETKQNYTIFFIATTIKERLTLKYSVPSAKFFDKLPITESNILQKKKKQKTKTRMSKPQYTHIHICTYTCGYVQYCNL